MGSCRVGQLECNRGMVPHALLTLSSSHPTTGAVRHPLVTDGIMRPLSPDFDALIINGGQWTLAFAEANRPSTSAEVSGSGERYVCPCKYMSGGASIEAHTNEALTTLKPLTNSWVLSLRLVLVGAPIELLERRGRTHRCPHRLQPRCGLAAACLLALHLSPGVAPRETPAAL